MDASLLLRWTEIRDAVRPADLLDVLVVACLLFLALTWLRRRGTYTAIGLLGITLLLYVAARWLSMYLTLALFRVGVTALVLGFVIVFQEEIRGGLERLLSRRNRKAAVGGQRGEALIGTLSEALGEMAQTRTGALIVLRGREPMERHIRGGIPLNGRLSVPLLLSLFNHESPAHDGAVIVVGDRIERFAAHLPLSTNLHEVGGRGTRHTAALGLSERCDALVLVVSEEQGSISVAREGRLRQCGSPAECQQALERFLEDRHPTRPRPLTRIASPADWMTAAAALVLAILFWLPFASPQENIQQTVSVPVVLKGAGDGWTVSPDAPTVEVTLSGTENEFSLLEPDELKQTVQITTLREGVQYVILTSDQIEGLPAGIEVLDIHPERIGLWAERTSPQPTAADPE